MQAADPRSIDRNHANRSNHDRSSSEGSSDGEGSSGSEGSSNSESSSDGEEVLDGRAEIVQGDRSDSDESISGSSSLKQCMNDDAEVDAVGMEDPEEHPAFVGNEANVHGSSATCPRRRVDASSYDSQAGGPGQVSALGKPCDQA